MEKSTPVSPPPSEPPKHWYKKRNVLIDIAVIVAVIVIVGVVWFVGRNSKSEPEYKVPQYSGQALVDEVNKKYGAHDYAGAINLLKGQKTINETSTQLLLAAAYANKGDFAQSLAIYDAEEAKGDLPEVYAAAAADVAERAQKHQKAIDFYQIAKQRADKNAVDQIAVYDYKIGELQKKL